MFAGIYRSAYECICQTTERSQNYNQTHVKSQPLRDETPRFSPRGLQLEAARVTLSPRSFAIVSLAN